MTNLNLASHTPPHAAPDRCFFCGENFPVDQLTREHVFPKWLQRKLGLFDHSLHLLNGTLIPYRNLTVPACTVCNGISLSRVEGRVVGALKGGADTVRSIGHELLYIWLAKIFYGILYAEGLLPINRAQPDQGAVVPDDVLSGFAFLHLLMQAARTTIAFHSNETKFHSSIMVFPVQQHPDPKYRFMYRDDLEYGCIAMRLDTVGLICVTDGGAQERLAEETMPRLFRHNLHPLQFEEMCAKVFTKARTLTRSPKYVTAFSDGRAELIQMPLAGISDKPVFGEWDQELYGEILASFTNMPLEVISPGNGQVMTWIEDFSSPRFIDVRDVPWP